jgi:anti-anti-sigma factor
VSCDLPLAEWACQTSPSGMPVLSIRGEIDMSNATQLLVDMHDAVQDAKTEILLIDLSAVTFIGCAALNAMLDFQERGHHATMQNPSGCVTRFLDLCPGHPFKTVLG